jgi:hypothetical protein
VKVRRVADLVHQSHPGQLTLGVDQEERIAVAIKLTHGAAGVAGMNLRWCKSAPNLMH